MTSTTSTVFPGAAWETATPESQGVRGDGLAAAHAHLEAMMGDGSARETVVIRHGRLIWEGPDSAKTHGVWSATKSFTSTCLGLLADDGRCGLGTPAHEFAPELEAVYPDVKLRHFTTMTSGYRAVGDEPRSGYLHGPSLTPLDPGPEPLFTPPGSHYAYWDSAMNVFALVLTRIAREPLATLFRRRIADPIGMDPAEWRWGVLAERDRIAVNGGAGNMNKHISTSARTLARLGLLFLHRGAWDSRRLLSAEWVDAATRVQVPASTPLGGPESGIDGRGVYGFNWWTNDIQPDGARSFPDAPAGMYLARGKFDNMLFLIPEWDMVVVRLGLAGNAPNAVWNGYLARIGAALESV
jgi:CubicO group peptidase (beta-lactamase class C family)